MVFKIIYSVMLLYSHSLEILVKTSVILHKCYVVCAYMVIILVDLLVSGICKLEMETVAILLIQNDWMLLSTGNSSHSGVNLDLLPLCLWFQGMILLRNLILFKTDLLIEFQDLF